MWNLKYGTNELIYEQKQTHTENRLVLAKVGGRGNEMGFWG